MRLDPGQRMAKAAERTAKATESAARALRRSGGHVAERPAAGPRTAGDLIRETAATLGSVTGMTVDEIALLEADFVAVWRRHYDAVS